MNLFYLAAPKYGGWPTFTAYLLRLFPGARLYKLGKRTEARERPFGRGLVYRNLSLQDAVTQVCSGPSIVTAADKANSPGALQLAQCGAVVVMHDPTELNDAFVDVLKAARRVVVIRERNASNVADKCGRDDAVYIQHPYVRAYPPGTRGAGSVNAVAYSRVDWDKHTELIAEANTLLPSTKRVQIWGAENRLFTHHKLEADWPGWRAAYRGRFSDAHAATGAALANTARFAVDMSVIAGDGGGTQYTFLEAWDAGAHLVVNAGWFKQAQPEALRPGINCTAVSSGAELAGVLGGEPDEAIVAAGEAALAAHAAEVVAPKYAALFG